MAASGDGGHVPATGLEGYHAQAEQQAQWISLMDLSIVWVG